MNKKCLGLSVIRSGNYETVLVKGCVIALGDIYANSIEVNGLLGAKGVWNFRVMNVNGIAKMHVTDYADNLIVKGSVRIERQDEKMVSFQGSGTVSAKIFECKEFNLTGNCRIYKLIAEEIYIFIDKGNGNRKSRQSVIEQVFCKKLIANNLKANTIIAKEVELHGDCKINTLICDHVKLCDSECVVEKLYV